MQWLSIMLLPQINLFRIEKEKRKNYDDIIHTICVQIPIRNTNVVYV